MSYGIDSLAAFSIPRANIRACRLLLLRYEYTKTTIPSLQKTTTTARATRNGYQRDSRIRWFRRRIALDYVRPPERSKLMLDFFQAIGGAPDALRMQRVVSFYEKLPRGAVPEAKAKGLLGRYQAKYFGKKTSVQRRFLKILTKPRRSVIDKKHSYYSRLGSIDWHWLCSKLLLPPS